MLDAAGAEAFAERARRELKAVGVKVRGRATAETAVLTAKEVEIARLVQEASPTRRSARGSSSARTRSNGICARSS